MKCFGALAAFFVLLSGSNAFAGGPSGTTTFDGIGYVTAVNSTCTDLNAESYGDNFRVIYLNRGTTNVSEGISFIFNRGSYFMQANSGSFNGTTTFTGTGISGHAQLYNQNGSASLTITPLGSATSISTAGNIKIIGSFTDIYASGCSISIHAALVPRLD